MTLSTTNSTEVFDGNGVTTVFPFTFQFNQDADLKVYKKVVATEVLTELTTGFTKSGAGNPSGGSVTFSVAPLAGIKIIVSREVSLTQSTDLRNQGDFYPEVHEDAFDRMTMQIQQIAEQVDRSVKVDIAADTTADELLESISITADASAQSAAEAQASAVAAASSASAASASAAAAAAVTVAKNKIINGNFLVNQRAVSGTVVLASGAYGHDRLKAGASGCTYTFASSGGVTTLTISAGSLIQVIEGLSLTTGTYALSWSGTAQGKIGAGSYSASGVSAAVTGGENLNIEFNTGTLSLVQLEVGSVATPFEHRHIGTELALCQRYYEESEGRNALFSGNVTSGSVYYAPTTYTTTKRAVPTLTRTNVSNTSFPAGLGTISGDKVSGFVVYRTANASGAGVFIESWTASAEL